MLTDVKAQVKAAATACTELGNDVKLVAFLAMARSPTLATDAQLLPVLGLCTQEGSATNYVRAFMMVDEKIKKLRTMFKELNEPFSEDECGPDIVGLRSTYAIINVAQTLVRTSDLAVKDSLKGMSKYIDMSLLPIGMVQLVAGHDATLVKAVAAQSLPLAAPEVLMDDGEGGGGTVVATQAEVVGMDDASIGLVSA
jgi:hypothetical protein